MNFNFNVSIIKTTQLKGYNMINSSQSLRNNDVFKKIFMRHWYDFKQMRPIYDSEQYNTPVTKMLNCRTESGGYSEYICMNCGNDSRRVYFSCKSSFCLSCSKVYVDRFVSQVSRMLHPGVKYRHVILTIQDQLRLPIYKMRFDINFWNELIKCGYECLESVIMQSRRQK